MAIEVLLRRSIDGVGTVGEVVRVRDGYARNYLLPYQMAALVTPDALRNIEKDKAAEAIREAEEAKVRAALAERLAAIQLRIEARAGEDGHLYGSVGPRQVVDALKLQGIRLEERQVRFETVRELGEYEITLQLSRQHALKMKLWVVLDPEDAKAHAEAAERRKVEEAQMAERAAEQAAAPAAAPEAGAPAAEAGEAAPKGKGKGKKK
ncbi:MAG: 50S ribosomal protein L9 [Planctomycetia bacterium]